ncbi:MAG TPA: hypothetical protein VGN37_25505 [Actinocatenispora sp.]
MSAYSADELRALATLSGLVLPPALDPGWATDDVPVADVVALRGLLAHGALTAGAEGTPTPTAAVRALLAPLTDPTTVLDLVGPAHRTVLAGDADTVRFVEREPDVWAVNRLGEPIDAVARQLLHDATDDPTPVAGTGERAAPRWRVRLAHRDAAWRWTLSGAEWAAGPRWRPLDAFADGADEPGGYVPVSVAELRAELAALVGGRLVA